MEIRLSISLKNKCQQFSVELKDLYIDVQYPVGGITELINYINKG